MRLCLSRQAPPSPPPLVHPSVSAVYLKRQINAHCAVTPVGNPERSYCPLWCSKRLWLQMELAADSLISGHPLIYIDSNLIYFFSSPPCAQLDTVEPIICGTVYWPHSFFFFGMHMHRAQEEPRVQNVYIFGSKHWIKYVDVLLLGNMGQAELRRG